MLSSQVFGRGDLPAECWIDGRRIRAATQAPQRKRPCRPGRRPSIRVGLGSLRSTHVAGDRSRVRCRRGNQRVVRLKPIRGAQDGLSTANAIAGTNGGRAHLSAIRTMRAPPTARSALPRLAACARFLAGRSRRLFARDRQQHFPLPFDALAAFLGLCRRGALRLHAATQRLH
jgi:hypothetical protein